VDFLWRSTRRQLYVATYDFPGGLGRELHRCYPRIGSLESAFRGLRQWLRLQMVVKEMLAMPSLAVDSLLHQFILDTAAYDEFCDKAYGRRLHRDPEAAMSGAAAAHLNALAVACTFALACTDEYIRPHDPDRLPVLFSVDRHLRLPEGQRWELRCDAGSTCCVADGRCVWHELVPLIPRRLPKVQPLNGAGQMVVPHKLGGFGPPRMPSLPPGPPSSW
jgi:hypothetical protein